MPLNPIIPALTFLVTATGDQPFFENEYYVIVNGSSAHYINRDNVKVNEEPKTDIPIDGPVFGYVIDQGDGKTLVQLPGEAAVGGLRTWVESAAVTAAQGGLRMILSDAGIRRALASGEIEIVPAPLPDDYSPSAVDICVGAASTFRRWKREALKAQGIEVVLDLSQQNYGVTAGHWAEPVLAQPDGTIVLLPYDKVEEILLCQTHQRIHLRPESRLAARVEGRSSLARLGLMVHLTAPTIHAGFNATITLEMVNHGPFFLKFVSTQARVCQFIFELLAGWVCERYNCLGVRYRVQMGCLVSPGRVKA